MSAPVIEELRRLYRMTWWALMLRGLFSFAVGIFIFARPLESVAAFALVIAFWALFVGMVDIVHAFQLRGAMNHWWILLVAGLFGVGFGIGALVYYPTLALTFAVLWAAWWLTLTGVLGVYAALQLKRLGLDWGWPAAFGALSLVAGIVALLAPPLTLAAIMGLIAAFATLGGVVLVGGAFKLRSLAHP
jgi:uncharacterized membrane protein HdeD (DUF308 family)